MLGMVDRRDVVSLVLSGREVVMPTDEENFAYLRDNWQGAYVIIRPGSTETVWRALACFGDGDELTAESADDLLNMIRRHYPGLIHRPTAPSDCGHAQP